MCRLCLNRKRRQESHRKRIKDVRTRLRLISMTEDVDRLAAMCRGLLHAARGMDGVCGLVREMVESTDEELEAALAMYVRRVVRADPRVAVEPLRKLGWTVEKQGEEA